MGLRGRLCCVGLCWRRTIVVDCGTCCTLSLLPVVIRTQARVVVLGGAFNCNGNVNPAAEANIYGDPDAANVVLGRWAWMA